jgi:hypothetical protein
MLTLSAMTKALGATADNSDLLDLLVNPEEASALDHLTLTSLLALGIDMMAIASPWCLSRAHVAFLPRADRYMPLCTGEPALIFGILDPGPIDLAAWWPTGDRIGTRLGVGASLGQGQIGRDGLGIADRPIPVFRNPLTWLRRHREGLVVADWKAASHLLSDLALRPENEGHGAELTRRLRLPPPIIVSRRKAKIAA